MIGTSAGARGATPNAMTKLAEGQDAPPFVAETLNAGSIGVPSQKLVHLQFRRFAGCPICNLHLRSVAKRIDEVRAAGVTEVAVFHSRAETMRPFQGNLPFDVIADPERRLYTLYDVTSSARSILDPRAWPAYVRGAFARHRSSTFTGEGGHTGLPADFLVGTDGRLVAVHYGKHADDQWSVDEILALAKPRPVGTIAISREGRGDFGMRE
jgi:peroxiredoxin